MFNAKHTLATALLAVAAMITSVPAQAGVVLHATRVVYQGAEKEKTVRLTNKGAQPALVQSWIDDGRQDADPVTLNMPFVISPPLVRLGGDQGQSLRLRYVAQGTPLPSDRESLFHLNVLEIPPKAKDAGRNQLQLAVRTRIKLFYRPPGLAGEVNRAAGTLRWNLLHEDGQAWLQVYNPSAYHVTLNQATLGGAQLAEPGMVVPQGELRLPLQGTVGGAAQQVKFEWINDQGALIQASQALQAASS